jgi:hypothetical protein
MQEFIRSLRRWLIGAPTSERVTSSQELIDRADERLDNIEAELVIQDLRVRRLERKAHVHRNT